MSRRVWIECKFEIEVEDLPSVAAQSVEELRDHGAQLRAITDRAKTAVGSAPGVTLRMWGVTTSPADDAG